MPESSPGKARMVVVGHIAGTFGVRGWVKVYSHTSPRSGILEFVPWYLRDGDRWVACEAMEGRDHGKGIVVRLRGYDDADRAAELRGADIAVRRDQLPELDPDDYYWSDLEGLEVRTPEGAVLGRLDHLFETGANDVMVVLGERERLVPYVWGQVVKSVDLAAGVMVVDWDADF